MKRHALLFGCLLLLVGTLFSEEAVEKLITTNELFFQQVEGLLASHPNGMLVDELSEMLYIPKNIEEGTYIFDLSKGMLINKNGKDLGGGGQRHIEINNYVFGSSSIGFSISTEGKLLKYVNDREIYLSGLSFFIMSNQTPIAFFVNQDGQPHAADTTGNIYDSAQAMVLLKALDPEKYRQSRERAKELGLEEQFLANKVLVWGRTYYSTPDIMNKFFASQYGSGQLQYDTKGYLYQAFISIGSGRIDVIDPEAKFLERITFTDSSKILSTYKRGQLFTSSTYVGFGGNIYFYVAGEEFTEVFRIRRTWGEPDFYAMAVNGYTEDSYGAYVKKVLKDLSKEDLRLLRNHLFALYGYVFKDAGLKAYFDKQVWYEPVPSATMESIKLPFERQALLEMILAEEKKR